MYGPAYFELPSAFLGMSRSWIAYVGPPVMMSVANVREMPYATSAQVTGAPVSQVSPSRRVKAQVLAPSVAVPVSVAMSGTSVVLTLGSVEYLKATRLRVMVALKNARSSPV